MAISYATLGNLLHTFSVLGMASIMVGDFVFTDSFTDDSFKTDVGVCGQFSINSININVLCAALQVLTILLTIVMTKTATNHGDSKSSQIGTAAARNMATFDYFLFWLRIHLISHAVAHLGVVFETAAGNYPPDAQEMKEALSSLNLSYLAKKTLPVGILLFFPSIRLVHPQFHNNTTSSSTVTNTTWRILLESILIGIFIMCGVPSWLAGTTAFFAFSLHAAIAAVFFSPQEYKASIVYPVMAAIVSMYTIYCFLDSFACTAIRPLGGHFFQDCISSAFVLAIWAFRVYSYKPDDSMIEKKKE